MDISGTLHFYSGDRREFFFVFDDEVAQLLYDYGEFNINDPTTRRVTISVGESRFIHVRTMSFSRKQTEIKVSLCSAGSKNNLGRLTDLYDWFDDRGERPEPFPVLGTFARRQRAGVSFWELTITEAVDVVTPPGLQRRPKTQTRQRKSFNHRREIIERDLVKAGRPAEQLALRIATNDYPQPNFSCLWRDGFLDSERVEIREMGIVADIDIWDVLNNGVAKFIEVKAQKVITSRTKPSFYMSVGEWRSYQRACDEGLEYRIWLFQYKKFSDFRLAPADIRLIVFDAVSADWFKPNGYLVVPTEDSGRYRKIRI